MNENRYNAADAHRLAVLSDFVYADRDEAIVAAKGLGADDAEFFEIEETEALVAKFGPDVYVAFRGTEPDTLRDLLMDARIALRKCNGLPGRVHSGFATSVSNVSIEVLQAVLRMLGESGLVYVGGHSKGGAEALLFAAWLIAAGHAEKVAGVHVFGCPAVGDEEFADDYSDALGEVTFCHVHRSDLIARSPVLLRFFGVYRLVGRIVYIRGKGGRTFRPSPFRRIVDFVRAISRRRWRKDHAIGFYIKGTQ